MTTHIGNSGKVGVGGNFMAEVTAFTIQEQAATADAGALGDQWDTHQIGTYNFTGSISCFYDETDTLGGEALTVGASVVLGLYSLGNASGKVYYSGTASVTQVDLGVSRNAVVTRNFQFKGNGVLTKSTAP